MQRTPCTAQSRHERRAAPQAQRAGRRCGVVFSRLLLLPVACCLGLLPTAVGEARSGKTLDIKVLSILSGIEAKDVEPKGLSAGDRVTMTDRLYNLAPQFGKPNGALVGQDRGTVTVRRDKRSADFRGIARLPRG